MPPIHHNFPYYATQALHISLLGISHLFHVKTPPRSFILHIFFLFSTFPNKFECVFLKTNPIFQQKYQPKKNENELRLQNIFENIVYYDFEQNFQCTNVLI